MNRATKKDMQASSDITFEVKSMCLKALLYACAVILVMLFSFIASENKLFSYGLTLGIAFYLSSILNTNAKHTVFSAMAIAIAFYIDGIFHTYYLLTPKSHDGFLYILVNSVIFVLPILIHLVIVRVHQCLLVAQNE